MEHEDSPYQRQLTGIHINLEAQAIEFEDRHGTIGRLVFGRETVLYEGQPLLLTPPHDAHGTTASAAQPPRPTQQRRHDAAPHPASQPAPPSPQEQA